jgi:hypothetical protein
MKLWQSVTFVCVLSPCTYITSASPPRCARRLVALAALASLRALRALRSTPFKLGNREGTAREESGRRGAKRASARERDKLINMVPPLEKYIPPWVRGGDFCTWHFTMWAQKVRLFNLCVEKKFRAKNVLYAYGLLMTDDD